MEQLSQDILTTVAYYDVLDYPLTSFEIWKYLLTRNVADGEAASACTLAQIMKQLETDNSLTEKISQQQGYYFLRGRNALVNRRIERNKLSERKYRRIIRAVRLLRYVPFVRMIAVTGRMALKNATAESDLDLLIILRKGHIFTGRALVTGLLHLAGLRRHGKKITDRICLNHFLTEDFAINVRDLFSGREYLHMLPVFGAEEFSRFYQNNSWLERQAVNYFPSGANAKTVPDNAASRFIRAGGEKLLASRWLEGKMKEFQEKKIAGNKLTGKPGAMIICNDDELAFWPNFQNQGPSVFGRFMERIGDDPPA